MPGCRIFHVPRDDSAKASEIAIDDWRDADAGDTKDQVMVFKYRSKFVAVNHVCFVPSYLFTDTAILSIRLYLFECRMKEKIVTWKLGMPPLIVPSFQRDAIRYRGLWSHSELWNIMSET